ncbi:hypothetical protein AB1Y20_006549 [Prymnesium parvum]|uniref:EF-hand domain-containing protein n=1 Tax=Prymnesium parvum TaxID=97485 RepID=A0AB34IYE5_PRYPA
MRCSSKAASHPAFRPLCPRIHRDAHAAAPPQRVHSPPSASLTFPDDLDPDLPDWDPHLSREPFPAGFMPLAPNPREEARRALLLEAEEQRVREGGRPRAPRASRRTRQLARLSAELARQLDSLPAAQLDALHHSLPPQLQRELHAQLRRREARRERQRAAAAPAAASASADGGGGEEEEEEDEDSRRAAPSASGLARPFSLPEIKVSRRRARREDEARCSPPQSDLLLTPLVAPPAASLQCVSRDLSPEKTSGGLVLARSQPRQFRLHPIDASRPVLPQLRKALARGAKHVMAAACALDRTAANELTRSGFRQLLRQLHVTHVDADDADALFASWDVRGEGVIGLVELKSILQNGGKRPKAAQSCVHGELISQAEISRRQETRRASEGSLWSSDRERTLGRLPFVMSRKYSSKYTPEQQEMMDAIKGSLEQFSSEFSSFSDTKDISRADFRAALQQMGVREDDRHIETLFSSMDAANAGRVPLGTLKAALRKATNSAMQAIGANPNPTQFKRSRDMSSPHIMLQDSLVAHAARAMEMFKAWDVDGDGIISCKEFQQGIHELGIVAPRDELKNLFDMFDEDTSGDITFRELHALLRRNKLSDEDRRSRRTLIQGRGEYEQIRKEVAANVRASSIQFQINMREKGLHRKDRETVVMGEGHNDHREHHRS